MVARSHINGVIKITSMMRATNMLNMVGCQDIRSTWVKPNYIHITIAHQEKLIPLGMTNRIFQIFGHPTYAK